MNRFTIAILVLAAATPIAAATTSVCAGQTSLSLGTCVDAGGRGEGSCASGWGQNSLYVHVFNAGEARSVGVSNNCYGYDSGGFAWQDSSFGASMSTWNDSGYESSGFTWWGYTYSGEFEGSGCHLFAYDQNGSQDLGCPAGIVPPAPPAILP